MILYQIIFIILIIKKIVWKHQINLKKYPNVLRWYLNIAKRPAVIKGYNIIGDFDEIPVP